MNDRLIRLRATVLSLLVVLTFSTWVVLSVDAHEPPAAFSVTFLDVGQGDAILIETPDGIQVLIDGGPDSSVISALATAMGAFDRTIDMVVATHPDADHIGGLIDVLDRYDVGTILMTANENDTPAADGFTEAVSTEDADVVTARAGQQFTLGASTTMAVLFPAADATDMETNASSIVLRVTYGETDVLLTGDAPARIERYLVATYGEQLASEILKIGHHGSKTSTDELFVAAVAPMYGVISAGPDNPYGHPHATVLATLEKYGVHIAETARGNVTFISNGQRIERR